jgi:hypothetical protein
MSPDVDGICKYVEYAVVDNQQELRGWAGLTTPNPKKPACYETTWDIGTDVRKILKWILGK